jgi:hypothetical protein
MRAPLPFTVICVAIGAITLRADQQTAAIDSQAREARKVLIAKVATVKSRFEINQFGDNLIVTDMLLEVEETMKGAASTAVEATIEGGTVGEVTLAVSDIPAMRVGDRAVFFLDEAPAGRHVPHKRGLGILKIDGSDRVSPDMTLADVRRAVRAAIR